MNQIVIALLASAVIVAGLCCASHAKGADTIPLSNATHTRFFYDEAGKLIGEYRIVDGRTETYTEYVYLDDLLVAVIKPKSGAGPLPPDVFYVHSDHLGTPRAITRSTLQVPSPTRNTASSASTTTTRIRWDSPMPERGLMGRQAGGPIMPVARLMGKKMTAVFGERSPDAKPLSTISPSSTAATALSAH